MSQYIKKIIIHPVLDAESLWKCSPWSSAIQGRIISSLPLFSVAATCMLTQVSRASACARVVLLGEAIVGKQGADLFWVGAL